MLSFAPPKPKKPQRKGVMGKIMGIYEDPFKWSLVKGVTIFSVGVIGCLIVNDAVNNPEPMMAGHFENVSLQMQTGETAVAIRSSLFSFVRTKQAARRRLLAQQFGLSDAKRLPLVLGRSPTLPEEQEFVRRRLTLLPRRRSWAQMNAARAQRQRAMEKRGKVEGRGRLSVVDSGGSRRGSSMETSGTSGGPGGGGTMEDATEEVAYTDSTTFLKGTQSANPHNDYCQHFVDTGERPQNFIRDTGLANRFEEYPKLRELIRLKDEQIQKTATPPMYLKSDLSTFDLRELQCKFDVILVEPPLEEYSRTQGAVYDRYWSWEEIEQLEIEQIAAQRSFIWIWCGSGEGLDMARKCLRKWGFRRCEDICWIKTNKRNPGHKNLEPKACLQRTKEHCLMGIRGTVRRSTDGDFIHANVDIDLIIEEEAPYGQKDRPVEIFHIIEHFCLGRRRLHLFGRDSQIRQGWLTVGPELTGNNFDSRIYSGYFTKEQNGNLTGTSEEIERLRPKSPPPRGQKNTQGVATSNAGMTAVSSSQDLVSSTAAPMTSVSGIPAVSVPVPSLVSLDTGLAALKELTPWDGQDRRDWTRRREWPR